MKTLPAVAIALFMWPTFAAAQVADTKATVYFFRTEEASWFVSQNKPKVYLNEKMILKIPEREYIGVRLAPGKYAVRTASKKTEMLLVAEAGKTYFVRMSKASEGNGMRDNVFIETEEQAVFKMRNMKPLGEKNIKDKALEVVKERPAP